MSTEQTLLDELKHNLAKNLNQCARIFHGRGKYFEGCENLNIEWYPPYVFVQNFADALNDTHTSALQALFDSVPEITAILVQSREWPDFVTHCFAQREEAELPIEQWAPLADNLQCEIKLGKNRNTGVFLDMRAGWHWVKKNTIDKNVLNLFSYTGIFSLFALSGGASKVDNVDMAANVLKIAQRNHQKNELHDGKTAFYKRNILKSDRWLESRTPYDLIIIDPPPYQKKGFHGWKDYQGLLKQCRNCLAEGGALFTCLNNPQVSVGEFKTSLEQLFPDAKSFEIVATADEIKEKDPEKGLKTIVVQF